MKGRTNPDAARRDRALRHLSQMTTAAAVGGTLAVVGFGTLAAATYRGTTDQAALETAPPATSGDSSTGSGSGTGQKATPTPTPTAKIQPVTPPTRSRSSGHVSTGGSG